MIQELINFVLSLSLMGLPIFVSDRAVVNLCGGTATPLVLAYTGTELIEDPHDNTTRAGYEFSGPSVWLDLYETTDSVGVAGALQIYELPNMTPFTADVDDLLGPVLYSPFEAWDGDAPGGPRMYQVNWAAPSIPRLILHGLCGSVVALALDVTFVAGWAVVVAFTRFNF